MNLLAVDTSTEACTVAVQVGGERYEEQVLERQHAERLLGMVKDLLRCGSVELRDLDAIVWGRGPGMFTGLRIGAGIVQGLAYAAELPVVCVSTLAVLAQAQAHQENNILTAIDARMGQVYWAAFQHGPSALKALTDEFVGDPTRLDALPEGNYIGVGSGWDQYHEVLSTTLGDRLVRWEPQQYPSGAELLMLGEREFQDGKAVSAIEVLPVYVRDNVAKKSVQI